jgi:hypothetical protein
LPRLRAAEVPHLVPRVGAGQQFVVTRFAEQQLWRLWRSNGVAAPTRRIAVGWSFWMPVLASRAPTDLVPRRQERNCQTPSLPRTFPHDRRLRPPRPPHPHTAKHPSRHRTHSDNQRQAGTRRRRAPHPGTQAPPLNSRTGSLRRAPRASARRARQRTVRTRRRPPRR